MPLRKPAKSQPEALSALQLKAASLLADGASHSRVAAELAVPLSWVQGLEKSLPMAAAVVEMQWHRHRAHGQRIRSLLAKALDTVERELDTNPSPALALELLKNLKAEPPAQQQASAPQMLKQACTEEAGQLLRERELLSGEGFGIVDDGAKLRAAAALFDQRQHLLEAPADPTPSSEVVA